MPQKNASDGQKHHQVPKTHKLHSLCQKYMGNVLSCVHLCIWVKDAVNCIMPPDLKEHFVKKRNIEEFKNCKTINDYFSTFEEKTTFGPKCNSIAKYDVIHLFQ